MQEKRFFERAGSTAIEVEFIASEAGSKQRLALLCQKNIRLFYALIATRFGIINPDASDSISMAAND